MEEEKKKEGLNWISGTGMIIVALITDLVTATITIITFGFGFMVNWIPNFFVFMVFSVWLVFVGEANWKRIAILVAPLVAGSAGVPGWTATIWPLVAKTIAAKSLGKISGVAEKVLNKL